MNQPLIPPSFAERDLPTPLVPVASGQVVPDRRNELARAERHATNAANAATPNRNDAGSIEYASWFAERCV